jgi:hypothetical protein
MPFCLVHRFFNGRISVLYAVSGISSLIHCYIEAARKNKCGLVLFLGENGTTEIRPSCKLDYRMVKYNRPSNPSVFYRFHLVNMASLFLLYIVEVTRVLIAPK